MRLDVAPEEAEAVRLLWEKEGGIGEIPAEQFDLLLVRIRERKAQIEAHLVQDMLMRRLKEGRRVPRRHQQAALAVLIIMGGAVAIVAGIISLFR